MYDLAAERSAASAVDRSIPFIDTHHHLWELDRFRYDWLRVGFWKPEHAVTNDSGFPCVRFRPRASTARRACAVAIAPAGSCIPEVEALVFLGWRLLVRRRAHAH